MGSVRSHRMEGRLVSRRWVHIGVRAVAPRHRAGGRRREPDRLEPEPGRSGQQPASDGGVVCSGMSTVRSV